MKEKEKGVWIAFEGIDGSGKTDQLKRFDDYLCGKDLRVIVTREPGGNIESEDIREIIFRPKLRNYPKAQLNLFVAAREMNIYETVSPYIDEGYIVLSDRSEGSTFYYQAFGYGLDFETIKFINDYSTDGFRPDLTVLLDVDPEIGLQRKIQSREGISNYFDQDTMDIINKRRKGALYLAENYDSLGLNPWVIVDANRSKDEVFGNILKAVRGSGVIKKFIL